MFQSLLSLFEVQVDCDPELLAMVKTALLTIDANDPAQKEKIAFWNGEYRYGFVEITDADYGVVQTLKHGVSLK